MPPDESIVVAKGVSEGVAWIARYSDGGFGGTVVVRKVKGNEVIGSGGFGPASVNRLSQGGSVGNGSDPGPDLLMGVVAPNVATVMVGRQGAKRPVSVVPVVLDGVPGGAWATALSLGESFMDHQVLISR